MASSKHKLTAVAVGRAIKPGLYADGAGLYLQVTKGIDGTPRRSWLVRFRVSGGKAREMGLGSAELVTLADARERGVGARKLAASGTDPIENRVSARARAAVERAGAMTFRQCAEAYMATHESSWKNLKHRAQWASTLIRYAYPVFGDLPVQAVDIGFVMKVLDPIWQTKTETATRLRGRIEAVLDWAAVRRYREGENPARWKGHLENALPARSKVQRVKHFAALPYAELPAFMADLRTRSGIGARALEFAILTATRTGETLNAQWSEIDLDRKLWTIPAARMKAGREHRVPLSPPALALLKSFRPKKIDLDAQWVFPGASPARPLSSMAMLMTLRRMKRDDLTVHGFRSTFRDWCAEQTNYAREVAEASLAHTLGNKVEAAYRRGDLFEKRTRLMEAWAKYCASTRAASDGRVVRLRGN